MKKVMLLFLFICCGVDNKGKIVSLVPSADEIIDFLGAKDVLAGVSTYSPLKDEIRVVGDLINPDYEVISSLSPQMVIITLPMQKRVKERLEDMGIKTYDFSPESVEELKSEILNLGKILGREKKADKLADSIDMTIKTISPMPEFTFVVEISDKPVYVAGKNTYISEILGRFGGKNAFYDIKGYKPVSSEDVISRKFDVIIAPYDIGNRVGFEGVCRITLPPDYMSPGLKIFALIDSLKFNLMRCFEENLVGSVR